MFLHIKEHPPKHSKIDEPSPMQFCSQNPHAIHASRFTVSKVMLEHATMPQLSIQINGTQQNHHNLHDILVLRAEPNSWFSSNVGAFVNYLASRMIVPSQSSGMTSLSSPFRALSEWFVAACITSIPNLAIIAASEILVTMPPVASTLTRNRLHAQLWVFQVKHYHIQNEWPNGVIRYSQISLRSVAPGSVGGRSYTPKTSV
ncbi:UPF0756 membrane protein Dred_1097, partial [Striga asiatica]